MNHSFRLILLSQLYLFPNLSFGQLRWQNVDSQFQPLPASIHIYRSTDSLDGKPSIAYYLEADVQNRHLRFTADTSHNRRLTPRQFYERDQHPLVIVNCTFFSFETNQSLNTVIKDGRLMGYNIHTVAGRGMDTLTYRHPLGSAIGISKKRKADVAWLYTDSTKKYPVAYETSPLLKKDSLKTASYSTFDTRTITNHSSSKPDSVKNAEKVIRAWKMETAVGGGPVLLQNGEIRITNNEELKFAGKAINDRHPRTAMGYTRDHRLIILLVQGRFPGIAEGATLAQEARLLKDLGCLEALNLDGGGSSCMLVNGKETIKPSDKEGQRAVPAVFVIRTK